MSPVDACGWPDMKHAVEKVADGTARGRPGISIPQPNLLRSNGLADGKRIEKRNTFVASSFHMLLREP